MKMTSAYANKILKKLQEDKEFYLNKEKEGRTYVAAIDEEPVIPEYDYAETAAEIEKIDEKIVKVKHAINVSNCTNTITIAGDEITIDSVLIKMAQLNKRKNVLDSMRKAQPKSRVNNSGWFAQKKTIVEYQYVNYDIGLVKEEYERVDKELAEIQIALDKYNLTIEFDVNI